MKPLIITCFTDPVCVWCWASEPVLRALETHFDDEIEFRFLMGGLVEDINDFADPANGIGPGAAGANAQVAAHWLQTAPQHGMPVEVKGFALFSDQYPSTYPQNIAYKAAQLAAPQLANRYLRCLRRATIAQGQVTSRPDVLAALAQEAGIAAPDFAARLADGSAKRAFMTDLGYAQALGVQVFPTYAVKTAQAREMILRGFYDFDGFCKAIAKLTDGGMQPHPVSPDADLLQWLLARHGFLALEEVRQAFDFVAQPQALRWLEPLQQQGLVRLQKEGGSHFVEPA